MFNNFNLPLENVELSENKKSLGKPQIGHIQGCIARFHLEFNSRNKGFLKTLTLSCVALIARGSGAVFIGRYGDGLPAFDPSL